MKFCLADEGNKQEGRGWELNFAIAPATLGRGDVAYATTSYNLPTTTTSFYDVKKLSVQVYAELRKQRAVRRRDRNTSGSGSSTTSFSPWSPASSSGSSSSSAGQPSSDGGMQMSSSAKKRKLSVANEVRT